MSEKTDNLLDSLHITINTRNPNAMPPPTFRGQRRELPCLRCMRSALAGKSTGEYHDSIGGRDKCFECCTDTSRKPQGLSCIPIEGTEIRFRGLRQAWEQFKQESSSCASSSTGLQTQASSTTRESTSTMVNESVNVTPSAFEQPEEIPRHHTTHRGEDILFYDRGNPFSRTAKQIEEAGPPRERIVYERRPAPTTTKKAQEPVETVEEREKNAVSMMDEEIPDQAMLRGRRESTPCARTRSSSPCSNRQDERSHRTRSPYQVAMLPLYSEAERRELEARGRRKSTPYSRTRSSSPSSDIHDERRSRTRSQGSQSDRDGIEVVTLSNSVGSPGIIKQHVERREGREARGYRERIVYKRTRSRSPRPLSADRHDERRYRTRSPYQDSRSESDDERSPSPLPKTWYYNPRIDEIRDIREEIERRKAREELNISRRAEEEAREGEEEMVVEQVDPVVAARRARIKKILHDLTDLVVDFFVN